MFEMLALNELFATYSFKKALDMTFDKITEEVLKRKKYHFAPNITAITIESLKRLSNEVAQWSNHMEYSYSGSAVELSKLYIDLDLHVEPISISGERHNKTSRLKTILRKLDSHMILLGRPGSGKTTTLKSICYDLIRGNSVLEGYLPVPIVIRLREVDNSLSIYDIILRMLNIEIIKENKKNKNKGEYIDPKKVNYHVKREIVINLLNENLILLIFDGFDEIEEKSSNYLSKDTTTKEQFVSEFKELCLNVSKSLIILTSRTADFSYYVPGSVQYELSKLTSPQIRKYIGKFFTNKENRIKAEHQIIDKKLLGAEYIPLTLTYLCIIYNKYGRLFNSRRETYNKMLDLVLEDWDLNRQIRRKSGFAEFDVYDKKRFLRHLAFELSVRYKKSFFSGHEVSEVYKKIIDDYENLSLKEYRKVFKEIETHTGLFIRASNGYMFSHKAIQEYLTALYMFEFPEIPKDKRMLLSFPNELALAVSFNENPSLYFSYLIMNRFDDDYYRNEFIFPFVDRLILEETNFKVHPYLAVSFLKIYTHIISSRYKVEPYGSLEKRINYFFKFLNMDSRVDKSLELLSNKYVIIEEYPNKNIVLLKKTSMIDKNTDYMEPDELVIPYNFYEYFHK